MSTGLKSVGVQPLEAANDQYSPAHPRAHSSSTLTNSLNLWIRRIVGNKAGNGALWAVGMTAISSTLLPL